MKTRNIISMIVAAIAFAAFAFAVPVSAVDVFEGACRGNAAGSEVCQARGDSLFGGGGIWENIINTIIFIIGAIAVFMVVLGGLRYVLSHGDQSQMTSAKNTILYAIVGLIIAVGAYGIVNFVLLRLA